MRPPDDHSALKSHNGGTTIRFTTADAALVNNTANMAVDSRTRSGSTILHPDHGTQFTSGSFGENMRRWGLLGSFGTVGDCFDNAAMESFWARMQVELLNTHRRRPPSSWSPPWPATSATSITPNAVTATSVTSAHRVRNALDVHLFDPSTRITTARNGGEQIMDQPIGVRPPHDDAITASNQRVPSWLLTATQSTYNRLFGVDRRSNA